MWVEFLDDFDWPVTGHERQNLIAYRKGRTCFVKRACGQMAIDKGKARRVSRPRPEDAVDAGG